MSLWKLFQMRFSSSAYSNELMFMEHPAYSTQSLQCSFPGTSNTAQADLLETWCHIE